MAQVRFVVTLTTEVAIRDGNGEPSKKAARLLESHLDEVMDELELLNAIDPSIELDLEVFRVDLSVLVSAANPVVAVTTASDLMRTAIHAAGGSTPDWPGTDSDAWSVRLVGLSVRAVEEDVTADSELASV
jgi:hypothetical protein